MCKSTVKKVWRPDSPSVGHFRLNSERGFIHALFIQNKAQIQQILGYLKHRRKKFREFLLHLNTVLVLMVAEVTFQIKKWLLMGSSYSIRTSMSQFGSACSGEHSLPFAKEFWVIFQAQPCSVQGLYVLPVPVWLSPVFSCSPNPCNAY